MIRKVDKRNLSAFTDITALRSKYFSIANAASSNMKAGNVSAVPEINSWTGNVRTLKMDAPVQLDGSIVEKAVNFLQNQGSSFGFEASALPEFSPDPHVIVSSTGKAVVHAQQLYKGVPVFLINKMVVFNEKGEIEEAVGDSVRFSEEVDIEPKVTVLEAAAEAAKFLSEQESGGMDGWGEKLSVADIKAEAFEAKKLVEFQALPSKPTVLDKSIFAESIKAHLVIFYIGPNAVLGWHFAITIDDSGLQCEIVISAADKTNPEVLYCQQTSVHSIATATVFTRNGGEPKELVEFPLKRSAYPLPENGHSVLFKEWLLNDETKGANVVASLGTTLRSLKGTVSAGQLSFDPQSSDDQQILNIFYFCNFMHDFFLLLGFDENSGNFEGSDPVIARAHNAAINGTANMSSPVDGSSPVMNMGIFARSGRSTALDADVVFHEYVHGVTNRLVGGRVNDKALREEQSRAMGEGWSDYFALSIQNFNRDTEKIVTGSWVTGATNGIRSHPYNDQYDQHLTYGGLASVGGEHTRGEVWCATLMHWTRHLSLRIGKAAAYPVCWQSIVDGLKLTNANPSFINARDGILRAINALISAGKISAETGNTAINQFWISFAKFGMGAYAASDGPWVANIIENFDLPQI